jgi:hypothetical protein
VLDWAGRGPLPAVPAVRLEARARRLPLVRPVGAAGGGWPLPAVSDRQPRHRHHPHSPGRRAAVHAGRHPGRGPALPAGAVAAAPSAGFGQLRLSKAAAARVAAHPNPGRPRLRPADHLRRSEHQQLLVAVVGYGQARGWSPSTLRRVQHSLAALLASQPTLDRPLEVAAVRQFLLERHLTALRVVEFLTDQGLVRVDEHAVLDRWLARRLAPLPAPIRAEVQVWIEGLRGRGARAGRPRQAATIQGYLRAVTPALADWSARYQSLRQVTTEDIAAQLEPLAGPTRRLTLAVLRSLFRTLKARRLAFTNPTAGLAAPREPPPPALGLDPTSG